MHSNVSEFEIILQIWKTNTKRKEKYGTVNFNNLKAKVRSSN